MDARILLEDSCHWFVWVCSNSSYIRGKSTLHPWGHHHCMYICMWLWTTCLFYCKDLGGKNSNTYLNSNRSITDLIHSLDIVLCQIIHPFAHPFSDASSHPSLIVQILHIIWEQSELWFIAYFSRYMPSGGKKNPKPCISLPLFSQNMVSKAKLCLLFQPQGGKYHLLSRSYLKYHYEYRSASFSSLCSDRFSNDETSGCRFEAHIYRSTLLWSKFSALSVREPSRLWLSYSLSNS